jgi:nicotinamidase-related amidase
MTTLEGRPNTALLVIDAQNAVLAAGAGRDGVVASIGGLVARARDGGVPRLTRSEQPGEMPLSGIRWQRER